MRDLSASLANATPSDMAHRKRRCRHLHHRIDALLCKILWHVTRRGCKLTVALCDTHS